MYKILIGKTPVINFQIFTPVRYLRTNIHTRLDIHSTRINLYGNKIHNMEVAIDKLNHQVTTQTIIIDRQLEAIKKQNDCIEKFNNEINQLKDQNNTNQSMLTELNNDYIERKKFKRTIIEAIKEDSGFKHIKNLLVELYYVILIVCGVVVIGVMIINFISNHL